MECKKCKKTFKDEYSFCPSCGEINSEHNSTSNTITTGSNSINIGLGNKSKQQIYIDNINVNSETEELIVEYSDKLDEKVIGGLTNFKLKFEIASIISIISALVTIVDYLFTQSQFTLFFLLSAFGLLVYAFDSRDKLKQLQKNGIVYNMNKPILYKENGEVFKVKKYGICPICSGRVYLYYDNKFNRDLGKCENNKDHLYTYDHTVDAGVPYIVFDFYHSE